MKINKPLLKTQLHEAYSKALTPNWAGGGERAVTEKTYRAYAKFIDSLPNSIAMPVVYADVDNTFSMDFSKQGVYIFDDGGKHYAMIHDKKTGSWDEVEFEVEFEGEMPQEVINKLKV